mgnify:CR=1 FL=1
MKSLLYLFLCALLLAGCTAARLPFTNPITAPISRTGQDVELCPPKDLRPSHNNKERRPIPEVESVQASFKGTAAADLY